MYDDVIVEIEPPPYQLVDPALNDTRDLQVQPPATAPGSLVQETYYDPSAPPTAGDGDAQESSKLVLAPYLC